MSLGQGAELYTSTTLTRASLVAKMVKNPPEMQETQVPSVGQEDPLEMRMIICFSMLVWRIPWTEEPGELQSTGSQRVRDDRAHTHTHTHTVSPP